MDHSHNEHDQGRAPMGSDGQGLRDEDLIARLMSEGWPAACNDEAGAGMDPSVNHCDQQRLDSWKLFVAECRDELQADLPGSLLPEELLREERLSAKILNASTREDVSWPADLRLVKGFLSHRLQSSVVLRVVAASLLVHMIALPVMAYYTWQAPKSTSTILFDIGDGERQLPYAEVEPEPETLPDEAFWPELDSLDVAGQARLLLAKRVAEKTAPALVGISVVVPQDALELALNVVAKVGLTQWDESALDSLGQWLQDPASQAAPAALRSFAADAWMRSLAAGQSKGDPALQSICKQWLGSDQPLGSQDWRRAYTRAKAALENSSSK